MLFWLSGLTCTWANFTEKAGAQCHAAAHGVILVVPDTSPRGTNLPGEHDSYDFGSGAGFYLDATVEPWSRHYRMASYVSDELLELVAANFNADMDRIRNLRPLDGRAWRTDARVQDPRPLPVAFGAGADRRTEPRAVGRKGIPGLPRRRPSGVAAHDACELVGSAGWNRPILVDQGTADEFLETQLRPELFEEACSEAGVPLTLRRQRATTTATTLSPPSSASTSPIPHAILSETP